MNSGSPTSVHQPERIEETTRARSVDRRGRRTLLCVVKTIRKWVVLPASPRGTSDHYAGAPCNPEGCWWCKVNSQTMPASATAGVRQIVDLGSWLRPLHRRAFNKRKIHDSAISFCGPGGDVVFCRVPSARPVSREGRSKVTRRKSARQESGGSQTRREAERSSARRTAGGPTIARRKLVRTHTWRQTG